MVRCKFPEIPPKKLFSGRINWLEGSWGSCGFGERLAWGGGQYGVTGGELWGDHECQQEVWLC